MNAILSPAQHVLTFAQGLRGGGVESAQLRLARGWIAAGRRVTLLIGSTAGPLAAELPEGLDILELNSTHYPDVLRALPGIVRARRPDILFCPGNFYTSMAAWARFRLGRDCPPIVAKMSNALDRADKGWLTAFGNRLWLRLHGRFIDRFVAMTPAMARATRAATGVTAGRISVIPNPPVQPPPGAAPPPLPYGRFILGVGRLEPQKRWERLIDAFAALDAPGLSLVILGEGSQRAALESQIAVLGLADRVSMPGHATDPGPAFARAALVALTSEFEGVPGALREALAAGTPVVTTDSTVAIREIVSDPSLGSVVPRGDGAALRAALAYWLAPGRERPAPVPLPGANACADYLALFDELVAARQP